MFAGLTAAGVTYHLVRALRGEDAAARLLPLAAVATVADVAPLREDNRAIVHHGLARFAQDAPLGLRVLAEEAGVHPAGLTAWHCAFVLGPRLNAAGRLDDPTLALRLLLTDDAAEARSLARSLGELNARRQDVTERMVAQAEERLALVDGAPGSVLFLADAGWSVGLVGLVASRLAERYHRPAVVLERGDQISRGSARSVDGFDIAAALDDCHDLLLEHGGHSRAAGLTVETARLELLAERLSRLVQDAFPDGVPPPALRLDAELLPDELVPGTARLMEALEPCGEGNPTPIFFMRGVRVRDARLSRDGKHLLFDIVARDARGARTARAVGFNEGARYDELVRLGTVDLAFTLRREVRDGRERLGLRVLDFRPATAP